MQHQLQARSERYFKLSSAIAQLDNEQLGSLFDQTEADPGWGRNHIIELAGTKIFVKRIPVTDLEYANQFSTRNFYDLPLYYNYGVGSAGFGILRELVTHIKTTNWVLAGAIETFPLLYHYRIIAATGQHGGVNLKEHQGYVVSLYDKLTDEQKSSILQKYGLAADIKYWELRPTLLNNIAEIAAAGLMPLAQNYVDNVVKYRAIIQLMHNFFGEMRGNPKKDTKFDHEKLVHLLYETGFIASHAATQ